MTHKTRPGFGSFCLVMFFYGLLLFPSTLDGRAVVIKAAKIHTVSQGVVTDGMILIRDGRIRAVGRSIEIPWDAEIIDHGRNVVIPGLVEAHAARGYDIPNETNPLTPFVTVLDGIDASHDAFRTALREGVTTLHIMPGHNTILGGKGAVIKPRGLIVEDMLLVPDSGMKISLSGTPAQTRMGVMAQLRRYFNETQDYMERLERSGEGETGGMVSTPLSFRSPESVKYESTADMLRGRYPAFIHCPSPSDVIRAHQLAETYGFDHVLILGPECYKAADYIKDNRIKVILDPEIVHFESNPRTGTVRKVEAVRKFYERGVEFALQSDPEKVQSRSLLYQAMTAARAGLSDADALKAVTLVPARLLGIDDLVGSVEEGKLANLVVLDRDPLSLSAKIECVYIEGILAYERDKDDSLKALTGGTAGR